MLPYFWAFWLAVRIFPTNQNARNFTWGILFKVSGSDHTAYIHKKKCFDISRISTVKANILRNEERIGRMISTIGVGSK